MKINLSFATVSEQFFNEIIFDSKNKELIISSKKEESYDRNFTESKNHLFSKIPSII